METGLRSGTPIHQKGGGTSGTTPEPLRTAGSLPMCVSGDPPHGMGPAPPSSPTHPPTPPLPRPGTSPLPRARPVRAHSAAPFRIRASPRHPRTDAPSAPAPATSHPSCAPTCTRTMHPHPCASAPMQHATPIGARPLPPRSPHPCRSMRGRSPCPCPPATCGRGARFRIPVHPGAGRFHPASSRRPGARKAHPLSPD